MSRVNALIADLVRAANDSGRSTQYQKRLLLNRAIDMIGEIRERAGIPHTNEANKAIGFLKAVEITIERDGADDELINKALLLAAGMIRDLYIISKAP